MRPGVTPVTTRPFFWVNRTNFLTVNLGDLAAQSKELESSDFEEIRVKSERA